LRGIASCFCFVFCLALCLRLCRWGLLVFFLDFPCRRRGVAADAMNGGARGGRARSWAGRGEPDERGGVEGVRRCWRRGRGA